MRKATIQCVAPNALSLCPMRPQRGSNVKPRTTRPGELLVRFWQKERCKDLGALAGGAGLSESIVEWTLTSDYDAPALRRSG